MVHHQGSGLLILVSVILLDAACTDARRSGDNKSCKVWWNLGMPD